MGIVGTPDRIDFGFLRSILIFYELKVKGINWEVFYLKFCLKVCSYSV